MEDGEAYLGADDDLPYAIMSYANGEGYDKHLLLDKTGNITRLDLRETNMTDDFKFKFPSSVPKSSETHSGADVGIFASGKYIFNLDTINPQLEVDLVLFFIQNSLDMY